MKVLQLGKFYPFSGGIERVMSDVAEGLSAQNIQCDILCASTDKNDKIIEINDFYKIIAAGSLFKLLGTIISLRMIVRLCRIKSNYDIIHIHHPDPMAALALFLSGFKGKVVLHWHSDIIRQSKTLLLYYPLQNWLLKRASKIITTSPNYLLGSKHLSKYRNKGVVIPIGIDKVVADFDKIEEIKSNYKNKIIIYSLGRLVYYKGYKYLINSANYLNDDYIILIGGSGPLFNELNELIKINNLQNKVYLLGRIPDEKMYHYYNACNIFCMSSIEKSEAFGIAQIEAMSCGKPIVATKIEDSGVSWVNLDGVSGINVECKNYQELASAFIKISNNTELNTTLSNGSYKRFETMFTKKRMVMNCLSLYYDVLENA